MSVKDEEEELEEQSSLLEEADEGAISDLPTFFVEAGEVQELLQDLKEASVQRISGIFDKYQEQPQLLDANLETIVRGHKVLTRFFPHRVADIEPCLALLAKQNPKESNTWEIRFILFLWLSILVMVPFSLDTVDSTILDGSEVAENANGDGLVDRIVNICKSCLYEAAKTRDAAAFLLGKLLTRPDMEDGPLVSFLKWLRLEQEGMHNSLLATGIHQALAHIFRQGQRKSLLDKVPLVLDILHYESSQNKSTLQRHLVCKLSQRIGLTYLPPRHRSLLDNLKGNQQSVTEAAEGRWRCHRSFQHSDFCVCEFMAWRGSASVGANVRDAASFVCWAFARAYAPSDMLPHVPELAKGLLVQTVLDREINCRRKMSDVRGITHMESEGIIEYVVEFQLRHWDKNIRLLSGIGFAVASDVRVNISQRLLCRHGAACGIAEIVHGLDLETNPIPNETMDRIRNLVQAVEKARLFRYNGCFLAFCLTGRGGEMMRSACSKVLESLGQKDQDLTPKLISSYFDSLAENLKHPTDDNPASRRGFALALGALGKEGKVYEDGDSEIKNTSFLIDTLLKCLGDYCVDNRGDVGSWVREAAMNTIGAQKCARSWQGAQGSFEPRTLSLLRTAAACQILSGLTITVKVNHREILDEVIREPVDWNSAGDAFARVAKLLTCDDYRHAVISGMVISIGGISESLVKHSWASLTSFLSSSHDPNAQSECILNDLLRLIEVSWITLTPMQANFLARFPRIRRKAAEELYMQILSERDWTVDVSELRPQRDQLYVLFSITPKTESKSNTTTGKKTEKEDIGYMALVRDMHY
ncbi:hypothetical protein GUITHDRAFT_140881 [Guillardia theta CCMP2712]|uniref:Uncharacterized protein n=1 Tax=Guillardia theta (strain CCMP2712) TaxID=905079 RepID=L1J4H8_GUITC|nr:hypothetical protein GUITHDRAFT_140881 [Guillardia theta CCMP2712]EKX43034.1 hypothetical protein GUITHDRAFT_140881 [Guillardia theta CCMP2712]|eukprot:XP_005830014.1 hypothetical protein GUITHDRAFT_140881 [Guillardia theta CCMP2712]